MTGSSIECTLMPGDKKFIVRPNQTVLEAAEVAKLTLPFGCRAGACGACYLYVLSGLEHIPQPSAMEQDTLEKLGKVGQGRLACRIQNIKGNITVQSR